MYVLLYEGQECHTNWCFIVEELFHQTTHRISSRMHREASSSLPVSHAGRSYTKRSTSSHVPEANRECIRASSDLVLPFLRLHRRQVGRPWSQLVSPGGKEGESGPSRERNHGDRHNSSRSDLVLPTR